MLSFQRTKECVIYFLLVVSYFYMWHMHNCWLEVVDVGCFCAANWGNFRGTNVNVTSLRRPWLQTPDVLRPFTHNSETREIRIVPLWLDSYANVPSARLPCDELVHGYIVYSASVFRYSVQVGIEQSCSNVVYMNVTINVSNILKLILNIHIKYKEVYSKR